MQSLRERRNKVVEELEGYGRNGGILFAGNSDGEGFVVRHFVGADAGVVTHFLAPSNVECDERDGRFVCG